MNHRLQPLQRTTSCDSTTAIIPSSYTSSTSFTTDPISGDNPFVRKGSTIGCSPHFFTTFFRSIRNVIPSCRWLALPTHMSLMPSPSRKVTGTLFGNRRGLVSFAVQYDPRSEPLLIVELSMSTAALVKEMSTGLVRIALECEKQYRPHGNTKLFHEPRWSMYCNGRKCGYAVSRGCSESDWYVLRTVNTISVGAGVIPVVEDGQKKADEGELLYMRARFERVVGTRDSEAFYMMNPDGSGGPELSIFLLRI